MCNTFVTPFSAGHVTPFSIPLPRSIITTTSYLVRPSPRSRPLPAELSPMLGGLPRSPFPEGKSSSLGELPEVFHPRAERERGSVCDQAGKGIIPDHAEMFRDIPPTTRGNGPSGASEAFPQGIPRFLLISPKMSLCTPLLWGEPVVSCKKTTSGRPATSD